MTELVQDDLNAALRKAIKGGNLKGVQSALDAGADIKMKAGRNNYTPLIMAVEWGTPEICQKLIESGASLEDALTTGDTALLVAARKGQGDTCMALIEAGANVKAKNNEDYTALYYAALHGMSDLCNAFLEKDADINASNKAGYTPLIGAAMNNHRDLCLKLIEKGADVHAQAKTDGMTALMWAAQNGMTDVCLKLIEKEAKLEEVNLEWGNTALIDAIKAWKSDTAVALINAGANVNAQDKNQLTALMWAGIRGLPDVCKALINKGADPDAIDKWGKTAFGCAVQENKKDSGVILLRYAPEAMGNEKLAPWFAAVRYKVQQTFPVGVVPAEEQCFKDGKVSGAVLDTCVTQQFDTVVGAPLLAAKQYTLFKKVWDALPEYWQQQNQGIFIEYAKRAEYITPPSVPPLEEGRAP